MRIGILTYHFVPNFGANLQVLSTIEYLKNNGFEPIVINWRPEVLESKYNGSTPREQVEAHNRFITSFLPCSDICRTDKDIARVIKKENIKGIIIGSDAVLQHTPFLSRICLTKKGIILKEKPERDRLFPNPFWGSFIPYLEEKIPILIMSASSQNTPYKYIRGRLKKEINSSLNRIDSITVRDNWTRNMIQYLTNGNLTPSVTPDPVFAYNQNVKEQYSKEDILKKFNLPKDYLLISFRSQKCITFDWMKTFDLIAKKNNLLCVILPMPGGIKFEHPFSTVVNLPLSPDEWYGLIRYSSGYIGENMHPIIVALHNEIPFFSFDTYGLIKLKYIVNEKSSKIYDILSKAGFLKNRINALGKGYKCPTPHEVFCRINEFDLDKCHFFSIDQQKSYNLMMENLTSLL
jgi:polysaccharide pyruvyl transferase WcaK-like protein